MKAKGTRMGREEDRGKDVLIWQESSPEASEWDESHELIQVRGTCFGRSLLTHWPLPYISVLCCLQLRKAGSGHVSIKHGDHLFIQTQDLGGCFLQHSSDFNELWNFVFQSWKVIGLMGMSWLKVKTDASDNGGAKYTGALIYYDTLSSFSFCLMLLTKCHASQGTLHYYWSTDKGCRSFIVGTWC